MWPPLTTPTVTLTTTYAARDPAQMQFSGGGANANQDRPDAVCPPSSVWRFCFHPVWFWLSEQVLRLPSTQISESFQLARSISITPFSHTPDGS